MEIDKTLELKYLKAILKKDLKLYKEEKKWIKERNSFVKKNFEFNETSITKLQELNKKLRLEEQRIFPFYRKLIQDNKKLVQDKIIDDFNLAVVISTFSNKHYRDLDPELEGNSIIETDCHFMRLQEGEVYFEEDWVDYSVPDCFRNFKHCYSFHHLYDHTDLTWYDLMIIEDIWFDIKIDYQFFVEI